MQAATIKTTNFQETLPPRSELMERTIEDPYIFDCIAIGRDGGGG
ncbi:MAG: hypothetical protein U9N36_04710 [Euryarchaeota archaeon]|nr:hypothetical protein [Euryarchaeota archaeon]